jgi:hypothetical protein
VFFHLFLERDTNHCLSDKCPLYLNSFLTSGRCNMTVLLVGENIRSIMPCVDSHACMHSHNTFNFATHTMHSVKRFAKERTCKKAKTQRTSTPQKKAKKHNLSLERISIRPMCYACTPSPISENACMKYSKPKFSNR